MAVENNKVDLKSGDVIEVGPINALQKDVVDLQGQISYNYNENEKYHERMVTTITETKTKVEELTQKVDKLEQQLKSFVNEPVIEE